MTSTRIAVIGAGSWGTALANLLVKKGREVVLWAFEPEVVDGILQNHRNPLYLDEIELDPRLRVTNSIADAVRGAGVVVSVSPSHVVRRVMGQVAPLLAADALIVSASKGIEEGSLRTMDGVLADVLGDSTRKRIAFLSGPSFALEVALEHPTAVAIASHDAAAATAGQELFQTEYFRVYTNPDVTGVELGGALKNVIAIAAGAVDGLGLGHNARAALITRGLAEITRLGVALGADPITFAGLAGMGDLILTCTGVLSRNHTVGVELGRGRSIDDILGGMTMVAEGVRTARAARELAKREGVEMPIVEEVHALLYENRAPRTAVENLMLRAPRAEQWR